jgi:hypothetical protein
MLLGAIILIEAVGVKAEVYQHRVRFIHGNHLETSVVKLQICLSKNLLQSLNEGAESCGLDCLNLKKIAIRI